MAHSLAPPSTITPHALALDKRQHAGTLLSHALQHLSDQILGNQNEEYIVACMIQSLCIALDMHLQRLLQQPWQDNDLKQFQRDVERELHDPLYQSLQQLHSPYHTVIQSIESLMHAFTTLFTNHDPAKQSSPQELNMSMEKFEYIVQDFLNTTVTVSPSSFIDILRLSTPMTTMDETPHEQDTPLTNATPVVITSGNTVNMASPFLDEKVSDISKLYRALAKLEPKFTDHTLEQERQALVDDLTHALLDYQQGDTYDDFKARCFFSMDHHPIQTPHRPASLSTISMFKPAPTYGQQSVFAFNLALKNLKALINDLDHKTKKIYP